MFGISKEYLDDLKKKYPPGTKIVVDFMNDIDPVRPGTKGEIICIDDMEQCTAYLKTEEDSVLFRKKMSFIS